MSHIHLDSHRQIRVSYLGIIRARSCMTNLITLAEEVTKKVVGTTHVSLSLGLARRCRLFRLQERL